MVGDEVKSARHREVRGFGVGAACGFLAGAFAVAVVVWQYGNVIGSRAATAQTAADPVAAVHRWEPGSMADAPAVLEQAAERPESTVGREPPGQPIAAETPSPGPQEGASDLAARQLEIPVEGVTRNQLTRQFADKRGTAREHEALDILAPRNTPVHAVEGGRIVRLFLSKAGGITVYQFDPSERYCYYYAHLERYAEGLEEGATVARGQILGYVGTSGNAPKDTPHLHFAVFRLTDDKHWWEGTPLDPFDILR